MLEVVQLVDPTSQQCSYLVGTDGRAVFVDPTPHTLERLLRVSRRKDLLAVAVLRTAPVPRRFSALIGQLGVDRVDGTTGLPIVDPSRPALLFDQLEAVPHADPSGGSVAWRVGENLFTGRRLHAAGCPGPEGTPCRLLGLPEDIVVFPGVADPALMVSLISVERMLAECPSDCLGELPPGDQQAPRMAG